MGTASSLDQRLVPGCDAQVKRKRADDVDLTAHWIGYEGTAFYLARTWPCVADGLVIAVPDASVQSEEVPQKRVPVTDEPEAPEPVKATPKPKKVTRPADTPSEPVKATRKPKRITTEADDAPEPVKATSKPKKTKPAKPRDFRQMVWTVDR
jgi:hypothetical protein